MDTRTTASLIRSFGRVLDTLDGAVRECPEERWTASLWPVDPKEIWVNDLWFWARDNGVSIWHTNWAQAARAARAVMTSGGEIRAATRAAMEAGGTIASGELEPPALRSETEVQAASALWRIAFHALYHCDLRLSDPDVPFQPPSPFTTDDEDYGTRVLDREDLLAYVVHCRRKAETILTGLTSQMAAKRINHWNCDFRPGLEINLGHLEEHGDQMSRAVARWRGSSPGGDVAAGD